MRTLYHFPMSPFSRRVRLALAHKGLDVTLRDGRADTAAIEEARSLVPQRTMPVFVDDGRALGDSTAITHWLDATYPDAPRLWPRGADTVVAYQAASLVDVVLDGVIDLGTRYYALRDHAEWPKVKDELLGRAQRAAEGLATIVTASKAPTLHASGWAAADIWLFTMVAWIEGWPGRAATTPNIAQLVTLGFRLPAELSRWADAHRDRADVKAL